jgi:outer membrane protein TolC
MNARVRTVCALLLLAPWYLTDCTVGPKYQRPAVESAPAYKEAEGWKLAQPGDAALHGNWWELFGDSQLNALEQQVNVSNQNIAAAFASFMQARAVVKEAQSQYFPTLTVSPSVSRDALVGEPGRGCTAAPRAERPPSQEAVVEYSTTSTFPSMPPGLPISGAACAIPSGATSPPRRPARPIWKTPG